MKKIIALLLVSISFLLISNNVYAENNLYSGDVIIGNTRFTSDTWISAARASKAGALYAQNTGNISVKTYIYINENIMYEMDADTGEYSLIPESELNEIKNNINIYYENNEPVRMRYNFSITDLTYDYLTDYEISNIANEDVNFDSENEEFICLYGDSFVFDIAYEGPEGKENEKYVAECGKDNKLYLTLHELYTTIPLEIDSFEIASSDTEKNNQDKVIEILHSEIEYNDTQQEHQIHIKTLGELNSYQSPYYYNNNKEWIGFRVNLDEGNISYNYSIYSSGMDYYVEYFDDYMNIYVDSESYNNYSYGNQIVILDNKFKTQEYINIIHSEYVDDLSYEYIPIDEDSIEYISMLYKDPYDEDSTFELYPHNFYSAPIMYYNNKMYMNKNIQYGSTYLFMDSGVLKSFESYTNSSTDEIGIQGIFDVYYYKYTKYSDGYFGSGNALSTNGLTNLYESVNRGYYSPQSNAIEIIEYFYEGEISEDQQQKLDFLASKTDMFIVKDTSNVFYQN